MKSWTIGKKLYACIAAFVIISAAASTTSLVSVREIQLRLEDTTGNTLKRLQLAEELQTGLEKAYSAQKSMIMAGGTKDAAQYKEQQQKMAAALDKTRAIATDLDSRLVLDAGKKAMRVVFDGLDQCVELQKSLIGTLDAGQFVEAAIAFEDAGDRVRDPSRAAVSSIVANQRRIAEDSAIEAARSYRFAWFLIALASGLTIATAAFGGMVVRGITRTIAATVGELAEGAHQVASAAGQVSGASQSLSQGATEQAASLEETSASMEEMASMTRKNAEHTQQAAVMMAETERLVHGANASLGDMVTSMTAIKESSGKVGKIIKTIDEIAFQTNILALNAAVEAARAGEAGMGFAVVADEVRALAHRSAQAAKDTAGLIEESIARSNEGQRKVQDVSQAIESITASTVQVRGLVDQVSEASRQQAQGIDQVSQAIAQMEKVTQGTAATAEESAAASEELNAQAETSTHAVARLAALVGQAAGAAQTAPRAAQAAPAKVVPMARTRKAAKAQASAEDLLPLGDTGTYGSF